MSNMSLNEAIEHLNDILSNDKEWECEECKNEHVILREFLQELKEYCSIGTVEECREAVERNKVLKPQEVLLHTGRKGFECRNCGNELSTNEFESAYCHWCGQRLEG